MSCLQKTSKVGVDHVLDVFNPLLKLELELLSHCRFHLVLIVV